MSSILPIGNIDENVLHFQSNQGHVLASLAIGKTNDTANTILIPTNVKGKRENIPVTKASLVQILGPIIAQQKPIEVVESLALYLNAKLLQDKKEEALVNIQQGCTALKTRGEFSEKGRKNNIKEIENELAQKRKSQFDKDAGRKLPFVIEGKNEVHFPEDLPEQLLKEAKTDEEIEAQKAGIIQFANDELAKALDNDREWIAAAHSMMHQGVPLRELAAPTAILSEQRFEPWDDVNGKRVMFGIDFVGGIRPHAKLKVNRNENNEIISLEFTAEATFEMSTSGEVPKKVVQPNLMKASVHFAIEKAPGEKLPDGSQKFRVVPDSYEKEVHMTLPAKAKPLSSLKKGAADA